jgi:hypothetical protein
VISIGLLMRTTTSAPARRTRFAAAEPSGERHLLGRRYAVLEVELDAVGAARVRLFNKFLDVRRHVEQRTPDRRLGFMGS